MANPESEQDHDKYIGEFTCGCVEASCEMTGQSCLSFANTA